MKNMTDKIDRPEKYLDIATKCIQDFRSKNRDNALVIFIPS